MIFKNVKNINIPEGAVLKIATALDGIILWQKQGSTEIPNNEIWYTSTDGNIVTPKTITGNSLISNTYKNGVGKLVFENEITAVAEDMFYGESTLLTITLPNSIQSIEKYGFYQCTSLEDIIIPNSVKQLKFNSFSGCTSLTSVTIPSSVESMSSSVFVGCTSLTSVTILTPIPNLGAYVFEGCGSLREIEIPNTVTVIDSGSFQQCTSLENVIIPNSVTKIGTFAFYYTGIEELIIPNTVTSIGSNAFGSCSKLTSITLPNSISNFDKSVFSGNRNLNSIISPLLTAPSLGQSCFENAGADIPEGEKFIYIHQDADYNSYTTGEWKTQLIDKGWKIRYIEEPDKPIEPEEPEEPEVLNNKITYTSTDGNIVTPNTITGNSLISNTYEDGIGTLTFEKEITEIPEQLFYSKKTLSTIEIPESVTTIGTRAFGDCSNLTNINLPNSLATIDSHAFSYCSSLTEITIPESVTTINSYAFYLCSSLKTINIPSSIININDNAFYSCSGLEELTIPSTVTSIGSRAFASTYNLNSITCESLIAPSLTSASFENAGANLIKGEKFIYIHQDADYESYTTGEWKTQLIDKGWKIRFIEGGSPEPEEPEEPYNIITYTSTDGSIVEPNLDYLEGNTLVSNTYEDGVGTLTFERGLGKVPMEMFSEKSTLTSITLPNSVEYIEGMAFAWCDNLTNVNLPDSLTSIGWSAFSGCSSLTEITIPESVNSFDMEVFSNCSSLRTINLPESVNSISNNMFRSCYSLEEITIPESVTSINMGAFSDCNSLRTITLPNSVDYIGDMAFNSCSSLTEINIPESVTYIGSSAFDGTYNLNSITCESLTAVSLSDYSFDRAGEFIPEGEKFIYIHQDADYESYTTGEWKTQLIDKGWKIRFIEGDEPEPENPDTPEEPEIVIPTGNTILYTTTDDEMLTVNSIYNPVVLSHTYENGLGTLELGTDQNRVETNIFDDAETRLKSITIGDGFPTIEDVAECTNLEEVIMGDSIKTIEDMAFRDDSKLNKVVLSNEITEIPSECFSNCSSLTNIVIPEKVTTIDSSAFNKTGLEEVIIPDSVTFLSSSAFWLCENLKSIVIGSGVTSLEENGNYFFRCYNLGSITVKAEVAPALNGSTFSCGSKVEGDKILKIPANATGYEAWLEKLNGWKIEYITE